MLEKDKTYRIFISAAEPSADAHCGNLIAALKKTGFTIDFVGVGGAKMALAGCKLLENTAAKAAIYITRTGNFFKKLRFLCPIVRTTLLGRDSLDAKPL